MIFSIIAIFVCCIILLFGKLKNRYAWSVSIMMCSLVFIIIAQILQTIKVCSYDNLLGIETLIYFILYKIKISYYDIKLLTNIGVCMYISALYHFAEIWRIHKSNFSKVMSLTAFFGGICIYYILNSFQFAEKIYTGLFNAETTAGIIRMKLFSGLIVGFDYIFIFGYIIVSLICFISKYYTTKIIYQKVQIRFLILYLCIVDVFFVACLLFGPFSNIITPSERIFDIFAVSTNTSTGVIYIYLIFSITLFCLMLWSIFKRRIFNYKQFGNKRKHITSSENISNDIKHIFHSYKNAMLSILILEEKVKRNYGNTEGETALEDIKKIAEEIMEQNGKYLNMFNKLNFNIEAVDIISCIRKSEERVKKIYNITIEENNIPNKLYVFADEKRIGETIYNIFLNAVEAIKKKGNDGYIKVSAYIDRKWLCISIWDNGCGMTKIEKKNALKPFFTTKKTHTNWGMGLSDACNVVEMCGGIFSFESVLGEHSEFQMLLRVAQTDEKII